jgi:hypothetical protein
MRTLFVTILAFTVAACDGDDRVSTKTAADIAALKTQVSALQQQVAALQSQLDSTTASANASATTLGQYANTLDRADAFLAVVDLDGNGDVVVDGANLRVQDGTGSTASVPGQENGKGNVIIGYDEDNTDQDAVKTGSHNLVVGEGHTYTSHGGFVGGHENSITARSASVVGGAANVAGADESTVCGGFRNSATGGGATVSGGYDNVAIGTGSTVSGGTDQTASSDGQHLP